MQCIDCDRLYGAKEVRELDRRAMQVHGIESYVLMHRAASAAWQVLRNRWPHATRILVCAGPGNNGGDGYELACLARADGLTVEVIGVGGLPSAGAGAMALAAWQTGGGLVRHSEQLTEGLVHAEVVVDAIFGVGLARPPDGEVKAAIGEINAVRERGCGVLAIDLPTGLVADSGHAPGDVVHADVTVTFVGNKLGLYTGRGPEVAGEVIFSSLDVPESVYRDLPAQAHRLGVDDLRLALPKRSRIAHKGVHGHLLIVGGNRGSIGAALLAARGALRAGVGLVSVATRASHAASMATAQPEVMAYAVEAPADLHPLLDRCNAVAIGPGLGQDEWARALWAEVIAHPRLVVDADALNLLALTPKRHESWILTPHPGEAARMLGIGTTRVQEDRPGALRQLVTRYGGFPVLKGAGTLVWRGTMIALCPFGNPGMAVGGMGDVLTGITGALIAQGLPPSTAAVTGVLLHARAGDVAAVSGERGMLPSDLITAVRQVANP